MFVGFACAVGVDIGFNSHHLKEAEHNHQEKDKKDDCCNDKVIKIFQSDKSVPQFSKLISPIFNTAFVPVYNILKISYPSQGGTSNKYYVRGHHPPIADIRIAIRSFQI